MTNSKSIFFDGAITPQRAKIRKSRLEASLRDLISIHSEFPDGFKPTRGTSASLPVSAVEVFGSTHSLPFARRALPASAFLVPAILDALRTSEYASITSVVPAEADLYCARAAKESGGVILTNDSDLLVYDLGESGAVSFLNRLQLQRAGGHPKDCDQIQAMVSHPLLIASKLGLKNFKDLAFVISQNPTMTLVKAVQQAKTPREDSAIRNFYKEYSLEISHSEHLATSRITFNANISTSQYLDPRLSELLSQSPLPNSIFLPFLTDDPSCSSAWKPSSLLRIFAYSLLPYPLPSQIAEHTRQHTATTLSLLSPQETLTYATSLAARLAEFKTRFSHLSEDLRWRVFAMREVVAWQGEQGKQAPEKTALMRLLQGKVGTRLDWSDIHLSAQIQAVLYSVRMLSQILSTSMSSKSLPTSLLTTLISLTTLPPLAIALSGSNLSCATISSLDSHSLLTAINAIFPDSVHPQKDPRPARLDAAAPALVLPEKGGSKREKKRDWKSGNRFEILDCE